MMALAYETEESSVLLHWLDWAYLLDTWDDTRA